MDHEDSVLTDDTPICRVILILSALNLLGLRVLVRAGIFNDLLTKIADCRSLQELGNFTTVVDTCVWRVASVVHSRIILV